jgi:membrane associated rhomboid family serine protease
MMRISDTVKHLIIINVIMFIGTISIDNGNLFNQLFALYFPKNDLFEPWQVVTHMFMHGGMMHILFNMFALWMFGSSVEYQLGAKKFLFIYFSAGLGAVLFQLGFYYFDFFASLQNIAHLNMSNEMINRIINIDAVDGNMIKGELLARQMEPILTEFNYNINQIDANSFRELFNMNVITKSSMVGASGCIMGILAAFGMMNPEAKLMMIFLPIPIKAKYFIPGIIILDLISAFSGQSFFSPSNTAYMAHVGGALTGFFIMWYWRKNQFNKNRWD